MPSDFRIGGVHQQAPDSDSSLLHMVLAADHERHQLLAETDTTTDADRLGQIHARLIDIDAYSGEARTASILAGLVLDQAAVGDNQTPVLNKLICASKPMTVLLCLEQMARANRPCRKF